MALSNSHLVAAYARKRASGGGDRGPAAGNPQDIPSTPVSHATALPRTDGTKSPLGRPVPMMVDWPAMGVGPGQAAIVARRRMAHPGPRKTYENRSPQPVADATSRAMSTYS